MLIRDATAADWPAIWPFLREIVAAGETYAYDRDMAGQQARLRGWWSRRRARRSRSTVPERWSDRRACIPNRGGPGAHVASASFMVDQRRAGRGVGRALGEDALAWAREQGFRAMQFNAVVETNAPAVALWRSLGFEVIGTVPEAFDHPVHGYVGLHVMHRRL